MEKSEDTKQLSVEQQARLQNYRVILQKQALIAWDISKRYALKYACRT